MNERLEAFRKRLNSEPKSREKIKIREYVSFFLSIAAFAISAGSTYYNSFREVDDVSVLVNLPTIRMSPADGFQLSGSFALAFVNAGSRSAVVADSKLSIFRIPFSEIVQDDPKPPCEREHKGTKNADLDLSNLLLKKDDVISIRSNMKSPSSEQMQFGYVALDDKGQFSQPFTDEWKRTIDEIAVCLHFHIVTPSGGYWRTVDLVRIFPNRNSLTIFNSGYDDKAKLISLLHQRVR